MYACLYYRRSLTSTATFDVQEVSVSVNPGSITITCTFAKGSLANGCHVILRAENVTDIAMNISREEQSGGQLSQTAVGQASDLEIGTYEITVSDLESDNTIGLPNPIQIVTVSVTEVQPSPTTPTGVVYIRMLSYIVWLDQLDLNIIAKNDMLLINFYRHAIFSNHWAKCGFSRV